MIEKPERLAIHTKSVTTRESGPRKILERDRHDDGCSDGRPCSAIFTAARAVLPSKSIEKAATQNVIYDQMQTTAAAAPIAAQIAIANPWENGHAGLLTVKPNDTQASAASVNSAGTRKPKSLVKTVR